MNTTTRETELADLGLLTVVEAARLLRISRNLAYELVAQHQIPSVHFGRIIRVPRQALEAWVVDKVSQTMTSQGIPGAVSYRR
jgi:excisionase family DNA binding protein